MNKKSLSERDICTKFINPAIEKAGWNINKQVREEVSFADGRIIVQGKFYTRGKRKRADYILYHKKHEPFAIIGAKVNNHKVGDGMQQALEGTLCLLTSIEMKNHHIEEISKKLNLNLKIKIIIPNK